MSQRTPNDADLNKQYGKGFSMLKKMGFKTGSGLGPTEDGIAAPIEIRMRKLGEGIQDDEGLTTSVMGRESRREKKRKPRAELSDGDSDVMGESFEDSSEDNMEDSVKEISKEDRELQDARKQVNKLMESKKDLQYRIFALSIPDEFSKSNLDSLEKIMHDLMESGVINRNVNLDILSKYLDVLRDRYDSDPMWYELDVESVIASVVAEAVDEYKDKAEVSPDIVLKVREIILDDEAFTRLLEFHLLPPLALNPDRTFFLAVKDSATPAHYESIYHRFIETFLIRSLTHNRKETTWLISEGWVDLVPFGRPRESLLEEYVKPRLTISNNPSEIRSWKSIFTEDAWKDIVRRLSGRISQNLKKLDPSNPQVEQIFQVVLEWRNVLSNCVLGFLLFESGFLQKWFEHNKISPDFSYIFKRWYPLLVQVAYHTPSRRIVLDALRTAKGEAINPRRRPAGPPPEFFSRSRPQGPPEPTGKVTLGDVVKEEATRRGLVVQPKANVRVDGCQVFRVGDKSVYWKDDSIFTADVSGNWLEVALDSVFS